MWETMESGPAANAAAVIVLNWRWCDPGDPGDTSPLRDEHRLSEQSLPLCCRQAGLARLVDGDASVLAAGDGVEVGEIHRVDVCPRTAEAANRRVLSRQTVDM